MGALLGRPGCDGIPMTAFSAELGAVDGFSPAFLAGHGPIIEIDIDLACFVVETVRVCAGDVDGGEGGWLGESSGGFGRSKALNEPVSDDESEHTGEDDTDDSGDRPGPEHGGVFTKGFPPLIPTSGKGLDLIAQAVGEIGESCSEVVTHVGGARGR